VASAGTALSGRISLLISTRDTIREFQAQHASATVSVRYRTLQQFFKFLVAEEELEHSPMEAMHAPVVPEQPVDVP
jgi:site-specific recombinase XerC